MSKETSELQVAVLGLGLFGLSIVKTLAENGAYVLACDKDAARLHDAADYANSLVQADAVDEDAMQKLGLGNFDVVVLAMGQNFEGTLIAAMLAKELGVGKVVAKANGPRQRKILESVGVDRVVVPEVEMGVKIARNLMHPNVLDVLEQSGASPITEMLPECDWVGKTIGELKIRQRYGYIILAIVRGSEKIMGINASTVIEAGDILIAFGGGEEE